MKFNENDNEDDSDDDRVRCSRLSQNHHMYLSIIALEVGPMGSSPMAIPIQYLYLHSDS